MWRTIINALHSSFYAQLILSKNNAGAIGFCHGEKNARGGIGGHWSELTGMHPLALIFRVMLLRGQHKSIDLVALRVLDSLLIIDLGLVVVLCFVHHHHLLNDSLSWRALMRLYYFRLWRPRLYFLLHLGIDATRLLALTRGQVF